MPDSDPDQPSPSQPWSSSQSSETYLLGFVIAKIVGIQYISRTISGREMVGLVREPLNPYDSNALRILNTRSLQVGHIKRAVADVPSPMIDYNMIVVEGISRNSWSAGNRFRIPCQVRGDAGSEEDGCQGSSSIREKNAPPFARGALISFAGPIRIEFRPNILGTTDCRLPVKLGKHPYNFPRSLPVSPSPSPSPAQASIIGLQRRSRHSTPSNRFLFLLHRSCSSFRVPRFRLPAAHLAFKNF